MGAVNRTLAGKLVLKGLIWGRMTFGVAAWLAPRPVGRALGWTIWLLARHLDVQERLAGEAHELLGERRFASDFETASAPRYGEAVLRESMRLKTVAVLRTLEPLAHTTICGTHIPAGTPLLLLQRHTNLREPASLTSVPAGATG